MSNNFLFWNERPIKRIRVIENALKNDPFLYHKKKNVISSGFNDSNEEDSQNINQELLFCQDENNKQINKFKNNINEKSSVIENNAHNYINYMIREKNANSINKIMPTDPDNNNQKQIKYPYQESFTPNKYSYNNYNNITLSNYRNNSINMKNNRKLDSIDFNSNVNELNLGNKMNISNSYKNFQNNGLSYDENNINNLHIINNDNNRNNNYLPKISALKGTTDITDHNYYDKISKQLILQMNKNYLDYNQNLINKRYSPYSPNAGNKLFFLKNDNLALPPGHISNPKYYNLGESRLKSNPIVNPGNRAPIFNYYNNHNHKLKSEFI